MQIGATSIVSIRGGVLDHVITFSEDAPMSEVYGRFSQILREEDVPQDEIDEALNRDGYSAENGEFDLLIYYTTGA